MPVQEFGKCLPEIMGRSLAKISRRIYGIKFIAFGKLWAGH